MKKTFVLFAVSCFLFAACDKNGPETPEPTPPTPPVSEVQKIPINISTTIGTRATDTGFENGDKTGIYVVNYNGETAGSLQSTGNHVTNMSFTYSGSWTPATPIYWKDESTKADFYCYYPYVSSITNVTAYAFAVKANQSAEADYKASDFLWGKASGVSPTSNAVPIKVKHLMSNLLVYLEAGDGYKEEDLKTAEITLCNLKTNATINLATGEVTAAGEPAEMTPKAEETYFRALVVPQSLSGADLVKIKLGDYTYVLKETITFESNKQHTCKIKVNKTSEGVNISISGWDTDDNEYGGEVS